MPPARTVHVPGRGEFFIRDTGGRGAPLLILHGWMASADLNWFAQYAALQAAGHRVIAVDHRGHGRGLRSYAPFRLTDCADDAVAVARQIGAAPAIVVGYSMGGPVAQLAARRHPDAVRGLVLCATSSNWRAPRIRLLWQSMALLRLALALAPYSVWRAGLRASGLPDSAATTWVTGELVRGSARDIAEAGRELGRFDSRPWLGEIAAPAACVVTTEDDLVPPRAQRDLAARLGAPTFEVDGDHLAVATGAQVFNPVLLAAIAHVRDAGDRAARAA